MNGRNVELLRRGFEAWNRGDVERTLEFMDPEIEWRLGGQFPDVDPVYHGHDGLRRFFSDFMAPWERISLEPNRRVAEGDGVVIEARFRARGRQGIEVDLVTGQRYVIRDERIVLFEAHPSFDEALAAAGLSGAQASPWAAPRIE